MILLAPPTVSSCDMLVPGAFARSLDVNFNIDKFSTVRRSLSQKLQPTEQLVELGVPGDTIKHATKTAHDTLPGGEGEGMTNDE